MRFLHLLFLTMLFLFGTVASSGEVRTNAVDIKDAPDWITPQRLDKIVEPIATFLEWDVRRVRVIWYHDQKAFEKVHGFGSTVSAFSRQRDNTIHIGPTVTDQNFDRVFGHEMVHIISFQKYRGAIPTWLEEGLANYLSKEGKVDYHWLAAHPLPDRLEELSHPYSGDVDHIRYSYMASQALTEMIAAKCDLNNLVRLSVGRKMENYLQTYCGIKDLKVSFKAWLKQNDTK